MTRKGQNNRMPAVNVNDGLARVIITLSADKTRVQTVGRYLIDPTMAMSAVVDAIPVVRSEELKFIDERFVALSADLAALMPVPNAKPEVADESATALPDTGATPDVLPEA